MEEEGRIKIYIEINDESMGKKERKENKELSKDNESKTPDKGRCPLQVSSTGHQVEPGQSGKGGKGGRIDTYPRVVESYSASVE